MTRGLGNLQSGPSGGEPYVLSACGIISKLLG
jgi:hypothetical protein